MLCKECGKQYWTNIFHQNTHICPKCLSNYEKRKEFRALMNKLDGILKLPDADSRYMTGFSYAEMERFSLIFLKLQKRFHFPQELSDFVNESARKEAAQLFNEVK